MKRKIIQITGVGDDIHALCNDGTVWWLDGESGDWIDLPAIPQPKKKASGKQHKSKS